MALPKLAVSGLGAIALSCGIAGQAHASVINGLTHLWNFESDLSDGVGALDGTAIGSTGFSAGKVGGSSVNLSGGYVDIASQVITDGQNNYSWSAWFRRDTDTHGYVLESNPNFAISARADSSGLRTHIEGGSGGGADWRFHDDVLADPLGWNLIVVTFDASLSDATAGTVYLNGVLTGNVSTVGTGGDITPLASTSGFHIGADRAGTGRFDGQIDQVAIWERTLGAGEVAALYNNGDGLDLVALPVASSLALYSIASIGLLGFGLRRKRA